MTSVSPFCGVHTELYSHVEWRLFGWCLFPNLGIISSYLVLVFLLFFALLCVLFCVLFCVFCGCLRFLLLSFVVEQPVAESIVIERDGGLGLFFVLVLKYKENKRANVEGGRRCQRVVSYFGLEVIVL